MSDKRPYISKSTYLQGLQCLKLVWFRYNAKDQIPEPDEQTQAIFEQGHQIGALAKSLFPNGVEIDAGKVDFDRTLKLTQEAIKRRVPMFEAAFLYGCAYARADILEPAENGSWDIIEVKSSTNVKDVHLEDLAFQKYVYTGAGLQIARCFLLHINNEYVRRGQVDPASLFKKADVTELVEPLHASVKSNLGKISQATDLSQHPGIRIGRQCADPYPCPLRGLCWSFLPEHHVFTLTRGGKKSLKLFEDGVLHIKDIPPGVGLSKHQRIQQTAICTGQSHVDKGAISAFLSRLRHPLHYLDFETFNTAIPLFDGVRPYQQVPFQFSLHVVEAEGARPTHESYLAEDGGDHRREFMLRLQNLLGTQGSIVTYNAAFETCRLRECAASFPKFQNWVKAVEARIVDLWVPFKTFAFYHPNQFGSASIKNVLPVLAGQGYESLGIQDGNQAGLSFLRACLPASGREERIKIRRDLEQYCKRDTEGMVWIVDELNDLCKRR